MIPQLTVVTVCPVCKHELVSTGDRKFRAMMRSSHHEAVVEHQRKCNGVPVTTERDGAP